VQRFFGDLFSSVVSLPLSMTMKTKKTVTRRLRAVGLAFRTPASFRCATSAFRWKEWQHISFANGRGGGSVPPLRRRAHEQGLAISAIGNVTKVLSWRVIGGGHKEIDRADQKKKKRERHRRRLLNYNCQPPWHLPEET